MSAASPVAVPVPQKIAAVRWCPTICSAGPQVAVAGAHDSPECALYFLRLDVKDPGPVPAPLWEAVQDGPVRDVQVAVRGTVTQVVTATTWGAIGVYDADWVAGKLRVKPRANFVPGSAVAAPSQPRRVVLSSIAVPSSAPNTVISASTTGVLTRTDLQRDDASSVTPTLCPIEKVICRDPFGEQVLTLTRCTVSLWDARAMGRPALTCKAAFPFKLTAIAQHPCLANVFATGDLAGGLSTWDLRTTVAPVAAFATAQYKSQETVLRKGGKGTPVWCVQYSRDRLLVGDGAGTLDAWMPHPQTAQLQPQRIRQGPLPVLSFDAHPDQDVVCVAAESYALFVYQLPANPTAADADDDSAMALDQP